MRRRNLSVKTAAFLLAAVGFIFTVTACGGGKQGGGAAESGESVSDSAPAAASATVSTGKAQASDSGSTQEAPVSLGNDGSDTDTGTVVVYSPHDADPLNADIIAFMDAYPSIKVVLVAGGTVELCDRIRSQGDSPEADVLWGGGADTLSAYGDCFEQYASASNSAIDSRFIDAGQKWTGESPLPMVIIYNKKLLAQAGIKEPYSWQDLLNPSLKGKIAYCQPSKSGSAYTQLCTMILAMGGQNAGWDYIERLSANLNGKILDSSGKCHKLVASGDFAAGITIEKSAALYMDNSDVGYCYPSEGTSAVPDAIAIVKNCQHEENAKIFEDFILSRSAQEEQSRDWNRRPSRSDVLLPAGLVPVSSIKLVNYDFSWAAQEKEAIIGRFNSIISSVS